MSQSNDLDKLSLRCARWRGKCADGDIFRRSVLVGDNPSTHQIIVDSRSATAFMHYSSTTSNLYRKRAYMNVLR